MKPRKKRSGSAGRNAPRPVSSPVSAARPVRVGRRWIFRLFAVFGIPLLIFGLLEVSLRLCGYGYRTAFFVSSPVPGRSELVENRDFSKRYFTPELVRIPKPLAFSPVKSPDTLRIFVFGESAAEGDPNSAFGFARILEVLLRDKFPDRRIEVLNTAVTAINSHVIQPIAREAARYSGDVWVIYMGNNEVVGPFGAGTVFGKQTPALSMLRASIAVKTMRTGQLLDAVLRGARGNAPGVWGGMEMFLEHQVPNNDPRLARVYSHFERNLSDIIRFGSRSGAAVVVSTVGSNLKDCPPFASLHRNGLSTEQLAEWEKFYQSGVHFESEGKFEEAIDQFRRAAGLDDLFADLQFRLARCLAAADQLEKSREHYVLARDLDALRFRADSRINEIIRRVTKETQSDRVRLADAVAALARESVDGVPGGEWFYEHVHLTFAGNYLVAREIAVQVIECLGREASASADAQDFLSLEECARCLALTDYELLGMAEQMYRRTSRPPFTQQLEHESRNARRQRMITELRERARETHSQSMALYREAIDRNPGDWWLHDNFAGASIQYGDSTDAVLEWKRVMELLPHRIETYDLAGSTLIEQGRFDEALDCYEKVLRIQPDYVDGLIGRGRVLLARNQQAEALRDFERAMKLEPASASVRNHLGIALLKSGKAREAEEAFRTAERIEPGFLAARLNLGSALVDQGKIEAAIAHYNTLIEADPADTAARLALGKLLAKQGNLQESVRVYQDAVRAQPDDFEARYTLGSALIRANRLDEAADHFAAAIRLRPGSIESRLNYATILASQKKFTESIAQFEELLRQKPDLVPAHLNLALVLIEQRRLAEASTHLETILRLEPGNVRARELLNAISRER